MTKNRLPECVGIIMDGNRRWAKKHGKPPVFGHKKGYEKLKEAVKWARDLGVKNVVVYAFSTENWHRPKEEVSGLMKLFALVLRTEERELKKEGVRLRFIGELECLPAPVRKGITMIEKATENEARINLYVAVSYGGRAEIVSAVRKIISDDKNAVVSEKSVSENLWTAGMPDPDLIIRTSGEMRLSNFLPWQSVYSELYFTKTLWPALTRKEFEAIIKDYGRRERRKGR